MLPRPRVRVWMVEQAALRRLRAEGVMEKLKWAEGRYSRAV